MEIYGCTYKEYREQYEKRLNFYQDKYEDRTESIFLERETVNFKDFHNILVSIHNSIIKNKGYKKLINDSQFNNHLNYLLNNYDNVFKELFQIGPPLLDADKNVSHPSDIKEEDVRGYIFNFDVTKEKLDNLITSTQRILKFINKKLSSPRASDIPEKITDLKGKNAKANLEKPINRYPQVFSSPQAYELFEKLHDTYKDTKNTLADYSFIYRTMYQDRYILDSFRPQMFIDWLNKDPYSISLDKLKTLNNCSTRGKVQTYNTLKEILQIK